MREAVFTPARAERLLGLLFPGACLLCGEVTPGGPDLCPACQQALQEEPYRRDLGFPAAAPFLYRNGARQALWRLKFHRERAWVPPLARWMASAAAEEGFAADAVTWAPMDRDKERRRGYNQSRLLARAAAKLLGLPALELLQPVRETLTQHDLTREQRWANVEGAYRGLPAAAGKRVLLVDDILTTGATMTACARALQEAGAVEIFGLAAAMDELDPPREDDAREEAP